MAIEITTPFSKESAQGLKAGDEVLITGTIYTARDAAHKRLTDMLAKGEKLPFDVDGAIIYYVGPTPAKPGNAIGSAGPTTSYRMDAYAPTLMDIGLRGMIGKGFRNAEVKASMAKNSAVYFAAVGGIGAVISKSIVKAKVIAFDDLGAEAVHELSVVDFPCVVAIDCRGGDIYEQSKAAYLKTL